MNLPKEVTLLEVGLRDGLQNEARLLTVDEKLSLIAALEAAGHRFIQVGTFVHPKAVPQMADTDEVFTRLVRRKGVEYSAAPIPNLRGLERAIACGCDCVRISVSLSTGHNQKNFNCTPAQTLKGFEAVIRKAAEHNIKVGAGLMMAFGSPWEGEIPLPQIREMMDIYMDWGLTDEISLADTSGMGTPGRVYRVCSQLLDTYPQVKSWTLHLHDTRGTGLANLLAGMQAGVTRFETAFAGLGGCPFVPGAAGNISTEDAAEMLGEMDIETGIDVDLAIAAGRRVEQLVGHLGDSHVLRAGRSCAIIQSTC